MQLNHFEKFLQDTAQCGQFGYVTDTQLAELARIHRLCQCLVICGGRRFVAAAQDVGRITHALQKDGDYVRNVSILQSEIENAKNWKPEQFKFSFAAGDPSRN